MALMNGQRALWVSRCAWLADYVGVMWRAVCSGSRTNTHAMRSMAGIGGADLLTWLVRQACDAVMAVHVWQTGAMAL